MSFLRSWLRSPSDGFGTAAPKSDDNDPQVVAVGVNETKKLNKAPVALKAKHFRPRAEESGRLALSTYCVDELDDDACWKLLELHVKPAVVARAELPVQVFRDARLTADPDWDPERHVNVIDWPTADEEIASITQEALYLAQKPILRPA